MGDDQKWPAENVRQKETSLGPRCLSSDAVFASVESVLVSSYVHLEFPNRTRPQELLKNLTLPAAWASLSPRMLTGLGLTTGSSWMVKGLRVNSTQLPSSLARQLALEKQQALSSS